MSYQVMPRLSADEYADLEQSIKDAGVLVPITVSDDGQIIDGHHRAEIADTLGIHCPSIVQTGTTTELRTLAFSLNLNRRHLNREQRRELIAQSLRSDPDLSDREHARRTGTSDKTAGAVRTELERRAEIPHVSERTDSVGRQQPATKPEPLARVTETTKTETYVNTDTDEITDPALQRGVDAFNELLANDPEHKRLVAQQRFQASISKALEVIQWDPAEVAGFSDPDLVESVDDLVSALTEWRTRMKSAARPRLTTIHGGRR